MASRKQEGNFHWSSIGLNTEQQLQELPHHSSCSDYPLHSSQCLTKIFWPVQFKSTKASWPCVSYLIYGFRKDKWLRDPAQKLSLQETQQTGWSCHNPPFMLDAFSPALLDSLIQFSSILNQFHAFPCFLSDLYLSSLFLSLLVPLVFAPIN